LKEVHHTLQTNYFILKNWLHKNEALFQWVDPIVGAVCFPQLKDSEQYDLINFYDSLYTRYQTAVGGGHWFEQDQRFMRIGFGYPLANELEKGLANILTCLIENRKKY
jgi:DNA-binding transcriptional MocR family regulator